VASQSGKSLTAREREVLLAISGGRTNSEIAKQLFLSVNTVRNHVQSVLTKLGAHSKLEAASMALREGLVRVESAPPRQEVGEVLADEPGELGRATLQEGHDALDAVGIVDATGDQLRIEIERGRG
jgi:DNA-binding CsgD family transcriptional regulator